MAQKHGFWGLILSFYLLQGAVECQWGLSFGWFWGNLEDLKPSKVESGVVKSSSHVPGSQTHLFSDSESSSSEEDVLQTLSSLVENQGGSIKHSSYAARNSKETARKKRLRKYRKRNKNMQRRQKYRKRLQAIRKRYNDHVRKKYGKFPEGKAGKRYQQQTETLPPGHGGSSVASQRKPQTSRLEELMKVNQQQTEKLQPGHGGNSLASQRKPQTSRLEELMTTSHGSQSTADVPGVPSGRQTSNVSPTNSQRNESSITDKNSNISQRNNGNVETTTIDKQEVEFENETETTDALDLEEQSTIPTTTTTELTTQEIEYEQEYYENINTFGFGSDVLESFLNVGTGPQFDNNEHATPATKTIPQNSNILRKGSELNTQASPLKSNDVAAKDLETSPQSKPYTSKNNTDSLKSNPNTQTGLHMQEASMSASSSSVTEVEAPSTAALKSPTDKPNNSVGGPSLSSSFGNVSRQAQTVSIPAEAERRFQKNKYFDAPKDRKNENQFNLHVDHPQAWKLYDIINPKEKLIMDNANFIQSIKQVSSGQRTMASEQLQNSSYKTVNYSNYFQNNPNGNVHNVNSNTIRPFFDKKSQITPNYPRSKQEGSGQIRDVNAVGHANVVTSKAKQNLEEIPATIRGPEFSHTKSVVGGNPSGRSIELQQKHHNNEKQIGNHLPGDNIKNGKNGKKINALFFTPDRRTTANPGFSSKIEKTWVDAFLPEKSMKLKTENQNMKNNNSLISTPQNNKTGSKTLNSLFSLTETAAGGKVVQRGHSERHQISPEVLHQSRIHPSTHSEQHSVSPKPLLRSRIHPSTHSRQHPTSSEALLQSRIYPSSHSGQHQISPEVLHQSKIHPSTHSEQHLVSPKPLLRSRIHPSTHSKQHPTSSSEAILQSRIYPSNHSGKHQISPEVLRQSRIHPSSHSGQHLTSSESLFQPRIYPSEIQGSHSTKTSLNSSKADKSTSHHIPSRANLKGRVRMMLGMNTVRPDVLVMRNKDETMKRRPISTLSHMPSSVTSIPAHFSRSPWDGSVNDRMSYRYSQSSTYTGNLPTKTKNNDFEHSNMNLKDKVLNNHEKGNTLHQIPEINNRNNVHAEIIPKTDLNIRQKDKKGLKSIPSLKVTKTPKELDRIEINSNITPKKSTGKTRLPNLISEGFPSRIHKQGSNDTNGDLEMVPDIPSQGDVHIKLPEIPTRLTKNLGQKDRTNSHQKSPPAPPVVVDQIQIPHKSVFSYPITNKTEVSSSATASIDGRLADQQRPPITANKLKLTLLESEQKPHSRIAAPNSGKTTKKNEVNSKIITAQNIQLIPYSNAIPMNRILKKQKNHNRQTLPQRMTVSSQSFSRRYDKPTNRHGPWQSHLNAVEKFPKVHKQSHPAHKSYTPGTFRVASSEIMNSPIRKERKHQPITKLAENLVNNHSQSNNRKLQKIPKTGGGRNIIWEMKTQLNVPKQNLPNTQEYQATKVKREKITKIADGSVVQNQRKQAPFKSKLSAIVGSRNNVMNGRSGINKKVNAKIYGHPGVNNVKKTGLAGLISTKSTSQGLANSSGNSTNPNVENELEMEMNVSTNKQAIGTGLNTLSSANENELESEGSLQTTPLVTPSATPTTTSGETDNEGEEENVQSAQQPQQSTQQPASTQQQDEVEYEYEQEYSTRDPTGRVGTAGDNIFSGSWKDAARNNAREIALEMEGEWTGVNVSTIGRQNTCPSYKMRYQRNAVVFDTVDGQCRVIITWNKRQQREQVKEKLWWGINTYYRSRTVFVPVVTYVDLR